MPSPSRTSQAFSCFGHGDGGGVEASTAPLVQGIWGWGEKEYRPLGIWSRWETLGKVPFGVSLGVTDSRVETQARPAWEKQEDFMENMAV